MNILILSPSKFNLKLRTESPVFENNYFGTESPVFNRIWRFYFIKKSLTWLQLRACDCFPLSAAAHQPARRGTALLCHRRGLWRRGVLQTTELPWLVRDPTTGMGKTTFSSHLPRRHFVRPQCHMQPSDEYLKGCRGRPDASKLTLNQGVREGIYPQVPNCRSYMYYSHHRIRMHWHDSWANSLRNAAVQISTYNSEASCECSCCSSKDGMTIEAS